MTLPNISTCCSVTFSPLLSTTPLQQFLCTHSTHFCYRQHHTKCQNIILFWNFWTLSSQSTHFAWSHQYWSRTLINKINSCFQSSSKTLQLTRWDFAYMCNLFGMHNYVCIHMLSSTLFRQLHSDPRGWQLSQIRTRVPATGGKKERKMLLVLFGNLCCIFVSG